MRKVVLTGWLIIASLMLSTCDNSDRLMINPPPGPQLTIKQDSFDFGIVPQHAKVSHTFWLYSTGDQPVEILRVVPG